MGLPPIVPAVALSALAIALLSENRHRSRSEWERDFERWKAPASNTESEKAAMTERVVREVLGSSNSLAQFELRVISQGSAANNTNTKNRSDVDLIAIAENKEWFVPTPDEPHSTGLLSNGPKIKDQLPIYRDAVLQTLEATRSKLLFDVSAGNKAIRLKPISDSRVDCDILPAFRWRQYQPKSGRALGRGDMIDGIVFITSDDELMVSFPEQHLANGRAKNALTNNRYKHVVRILKKLRDRFDSRATILTQCDLPSSYEIECLVYNVPYHLLTDGTVYDATLQTARWLSENLSVGFSCDRLVQVHGIYSMFSHWSGSLLSGLFCKPEEAETCEDFINRVISEIETGS